MSFNKLGLSSALLKSIQAKGYSEPSEIQQEAIPEILKGNDILAGAQTGTGKTAAFALPILHRLQNAESKRRRVRVLVLVPTSCLLYTSPSPRDQRGSRMPSSA